MIDFTKFNNITDLTLYFKDEQTCREAIAETRWVGGDVICPYCGHHHCKKGYRGRYVCSHCGNKFSELVGTIFENTKVSLRKWFIAMYLISSHKKGISSCQLCKDISVTQKTAWYMLQKIRTLFEQDNEPVESDFEVDEVYIGGQEKWKHAHKKTPTSMGRSHTTKTPVFGMINRVGGIVNAYVVPDTTKMHIYPFIYKHICPGSTIYSDEAPVYKSLKADFGHAIIRHHFRKYSVGGKTTNRIENFWSHLKRMINGIYHNVHPEHLQSYVDEEVFRWNTRSHSQMYRFSVIMKKGMTTRIPYSFVKM